MESKYLIIDQLTLAFLLETKADCPYYGYPGHTENDLDAAALQHLCRMPYHDPT